MVSLYLYLYVLVRSLLFPALACTQISPSACFIAIARQLSKFPLQKVLLANQMPALSGTFVASAWIRLQSRGSPSRLRTAKPRWD